MKKIVFIFILFCYIINPIETKATLNSEPTKKDSLILFSNKTIESNKSDDDVFQFKPNPQKAVFYALVPGLGQIYNRKYWKLPILYGAFVGLSYGVSWNNKYYTDYKQAYIDILDTDPNTNSYINMLPAGQSMEEINQDWFVSVLKQKKEVYRRYRDLNIIGIFGLYALSIVDAYVDAHLFDFDISQNLTLRLQPHIEYNTNQPTFGLQCRLKF